jgi:hypothetical protein
VGVGLAPSFVFATVDDIGTGLACFAHVGGRTTTKFDVAGWNATGSITNVDLGFYWLAIA